MNVQGLDIVDGQVNLVLGVIWQLCNVYWEERVGKIKGDALLVWSNSKVGTEMKIKSFEDRPVALGLYLAYLIHAVRPEAVDLKKLRAPETD